MKIVQIISVLFILVTTYSGMDAQVNLTNTAIIETNQNHTSVSDTLVSKVGSSDPILTPEQQGFTKFIMPDGSIIYRKEAGMLMIEYKPK